MTGQNRASSRKARRNQMRTSLILIALAIVNYLPVAIWVIVFPLLAPRNEFT